MQAPLACWRCEQPGHGWRECDRPPAKTKQELHQRINHIAVRWDAGNGGFSRAVKSSIVKAEINAYNACERNRK